MTSTPGTDHDGKGYSAIEKIAIFAYPIVHVRCISSISTLRHPPGCLFYCGSMFGVK